jgi:hypothetical protein
MFGTGLRRHITCACQLALIVRIVTCCALAPLTCGQRAKLKPMQLPKEQMFDKSGQWIRLETFDDFDNGLSNLIDLWSSTAKTASKAVKASALAHFKHDLEAATLEWIDNRAKTKKYAAIGKELAEFEEVLNQDSSTGL